MMRYLQWIRILLLSLLYVGVILLPADSLFSSKGMVENVQFDSKLKCNASSKKIFGVSSEMQCVHKCAFNEKCEIINYMHHDKDDDFYENCEIYTLSKFDSSCTTLTGMPGWKSMTFHNGDSCRSLKYNHCFPCDCPEICKAGETASCKCITGSSRLPAIFISFEAEHPSMTVEYERGADTAGNSSVQLKRGANIGQSDGRQGNVLRLTGQDASALVGTFESHPLNNPNTGYNTFSLWIKVLSAQSETQTLFGSGKVQSNTGILLRLQDFAQKIYAAGIISTKHVAMTYSVGNILKSWTHLALVEYGSSSPSLKLYVNGVLVKSATTAIAYSTSTTVFSKLVFGADDGLYPLTSSSFDIHIDDFSYWNQALADAEIAYVMKKDFAFCEKHTKFS